MSTTDLDLDIRKLVCHCLRGGQVDILPLNGNDHSFVLGCFEREVCSIAFSTIGHPPVEHFFYYVISTFLTEMLVVKKRPVVVLTNAESSILAVMTTSSMCHNQT